MTGLRRPIKYRPDIDGLRAVAIIVVFGYHAGLRWLPGGFVGVDIFFVISGYLIGTLVYKEIRGNSFSISKFYARRARRILPALVTVLAVCYAGAFLMLPPSELTRFSLSALATVGSGSNLYFWRALDYFHGDARNDPLLMTWSLGVEEQFYLLFPLLLLSTRKLRWQTQLLLIALLAGGSFALSCWSIRSHLVPDFYLLPTRAWELAAGVLLAILEINRAHGRPWISAKVAQVVGVFGIGMIATACFRFDGTMAYPGFLALLPVSGAVLVIAARSGVTNRMLGLRPLVFVGLVSYSWYLWHWPIISFAHIVQQSVFTAWQVFVIGALSFLCAWLSFKLIEQQFRASATPPSTLFKRYAFVLAVAALPPLVAFVADGLPQRNRTVAIIDASQQQLELDPCLLNVWTIEPLLHSPCMPPGNGPEVALMGDSHAAAIAGAMRTISARHGFRLLELAGVSCPVFEGALLFNYPNTEVTEKCEEFNRSRIDYVVNDPSVKVVIIAGFWTAVFRPSVAPPGDQSYLQNSFAMDRGMMNDLHQGLDRLVTRLQRSGKICYLVEDNAEFSFDPKGIMYDRAILARRLVAILLTSPARLYLDGRAPELDPESAKLSDEMVGEVAAAHPDVHLIDLHSALCDQDSCRFAAGDRLLYLDENHLSGAGAQIALSGFNFQ